MGQSRKKILVFTEKYLAISETFIYNQISSLEKQLEVKVVCIEVQNNDVFPTQNIICLGSDTRLNLLSKIGSGMVRRNIYLGIGTSIYNDRFSQIVNDTKPDYILIHYGKSALTIKNALMKWSGPVFIYFHGYDASMLLNQSYTYRKAIGHLLSHKNVHALFVSEALKKSFLKYFKDLDCRHKVIKLGIDSNQFLRNAYELNKKMVQVGRLVEKKGHLYTLKALKLLQDKGETGGVHYTIVGDGPMHEPIRQAIKNMSLEHLVTVHTHVSKDKIWSFLNEATLFVQHSITTDAGDTEGLPIALMEAMAMEMPIVSTIHSGIPELVEDGIDGYLSEETNIQHFADNLEKGLSMGFLPHNRKKILITHNIDEQTCALIGYMAQNVI
jgi:colanic acid/amylovoran biosynthesis glycosyltransferase